jgi:hypothetical protein
MANQQPKQPHRPQFREDHKVQKLIERIENKLILPAKAAREVSQSGSKN